MKLDFTDFLYAMSFALDAVEHEFTGATEEHGKRVAWLSMKMADGCGMSEEQLVDFIGCAILHDNAIAEYLQEERKLRMGDGCMPTESLNAAAKTDRVRLTDYGRLARHVVIGERNAGLLPFRTDVKNAILWHHENADGSGALGLRQDQTSLQSELIHLADTVDLLYDLKTIRPEGFEGVRRFVAGETGRLFSERAAEQFERKVAFSDIKALQEEGPEALLKKRIPAVWHDYTDDEIKAIAEFFARIIDYKSPFTTVHSLGVADKARRMAEYYQWNPDKAVSFYLAGAMHDIGKVVVGNEILEKPGKLDAAEFSRMKDHAAATLHILSDIDGLTEITEWAANHHEKLDGSGYSRGMSAEQLSFEERLMACIDIYQALTEDRPYKAGLSHAKTMAMMRSMAGENKIDGNIVKDLDAVFGMQGSGVTDERSAAAEPGAVTETRGVAEPGAATENRAAAEHSASTENRASAAHGTAAELQWKCNVCGYISEGDFPPDQCPVCHSDSGQFVPCSV